MKITLNEDALQKLVQPALNDIAESYERDFAELSREYSGKSINEIKPAVKHVFAKHGGKIDDSELTEYAQCISDGIEIHFQA